LIERVDIEQLYKIPVKYPFTFMGRNFCVLKMKHSRLAILEANLITKTKNFCEQPNYKNFFLIKIASSMLSHEKL